MNKLWFILLFQIWGCELFEAENICIVNNNLSETIPHCYTNISEAQCLTYSNQTNYSFVKFDNDESCEEYCEYNFGCILH